MQYWSVICQMEMARRVGRWREPVLVSRWLVVEFAGCRVVALRCYMGEPRNQFCVASSSYLVFPISLWSLLVVRSPVLEVFNCQQVRRLRSHCSSTTYKAHIRQDI
jgi:hypothetical protein